LQFFTTYEHQYYFENSLPISISITMPYGRSPGRRYQALQTCQVCGKQTTYGFAHRYHVCTPPPPPRRAVVNAVEEHALEEEVIDNALQDDDADDEHVEEDDVFTVLGGEFVEGTPLFTYLQNPEHEGICRYLNWGKKQLPSTDLEILRFLAVVDGAGGMSHSSANRVLRYVRGQGGRSARLPKLVATCWASLERVNRQYIYNLPPTFILKYLLNSSNCNNYKEFKK